MKKQQTNLNTQKVKPIITENRRLQKTLESDIVRLNESPYESFSLLDRQLQELTEDQFVF